MSALTKWRLLVVFAVFVEFLVSVGPVYNYSVFLVPLQTEFKTSIVLTGWVGSLGSALLCTLSPLAAVVAWKIGSTSVVFLGIILTAAGYLATSFISSLAQGYLTFGLMVGFGTGFTFCGSCNVLVEWYAGQTNACRPTAAALTGSSVGVMVFGPLLNTLTASYGWRHCFRILSGMMLGLGLLVALPFFKRPERGEERDQAKEDDLKSQSGDHLPEHTGKSSEDPTQGSTDLKPSRQDLDSKDPVPSSRTPVKYFCEMVLNVEVWLWVSSITLAQLGWSFIIINFTSFLEGLGLSTESISLALTVLGAAEVGGKIVVALAGDRLPCLKLYLVVAASIIAAIVSGFLTFLSAFWSIILMSVVWGYCRGTTFGVSVAACMELFEMYGSGAVMTIAVFGFGAGVLTGAPITGVFYDLTGNYTLSLFAVLASFGFSSLCAVLIPIKRRCILKSPCCRRASKNIENNNQEEETKVNRTELEMETRSVGTSNLAFEIEI